MLFIVPRQLGSQEKTPVRLKSGIPGTPIISLVLDITEK